MSQGFKYSILEPKVLVTDSNNWLAEAIEAEFGKLPLKLTKHDLEEVEGIAMRMANPDELLPILEALRDGKEIYLELHT